MKLPFKFFFITIFAFFQLFFLSPTAIFATQIDINEVQLSNQKSEGQIFAKKLLKAFGGVVVCCTFLFFVLFFYKTHKKFNEQKIICSNLEDSLVEPNSIEQATVNFIIKGR